MKNLKQVVLNNVVKATHETQLTIQEKEQLSNNLFFKLSNDLQGNNLLQLAMGNGLLPHDLEVEEYFISNLLYCSRQDAIMYLGMVDYTYFLGSKFRFIHEAICVLLSEKIPIKTQSVGIKLKELGYYNTIQNELGYAVEDFLISLYESGKYEKISLEAMEKIIETLFLLMQKRKLCDIGFLLVNESPNLLQDNLEHFKSEVVNSLSKLDALQAQNKEAHDGKKLADAFKLFTNDVLSSETGLTGYPTAIIDLTRLLGGWKRTNYIVIGGRPGTGKTALMLTEAWQAAVRGERVVFFSLEMSAQEMAVRLFCIHTKTENEIFKDKQKAGENFAQFEIFLQFLSSIGDKFVLYDRVGISADYISRIVSYENRQGSLDRVYVDYIQLLNHPNKSVINPEQVISYNSTLLKQIAMRENIVVIAGSQLSREGEKQNFSSSGVSRKPQLIDLRGSGSLEQDGNVVLFTYRAELYNITEDEQGRDTEGIGTILVRKNRSGALGEIRCFFDAKTTAWRELVNDSPFNYNKLSENDL
jgi:replicative DNA helicase